MKNQQLIQTYRQLDFDLAALHSVLNSTRENKMTLFIPHKENCAMVKKQLDELKLRIDALETPAKPFEFIKNHFYDFFHSLKLQSDGMENNPQGYLYSVGWKIVPLILDAEDFTAGYDILFSRLDCVKNIVYALKESCTDDRAGNTADAVKDLG